MSLVTIHTTQNVDIDYELAGTGSRIAAFILDAIIFLVAYGIVVLVLASADLSTSVEVMAYLAPLFLFLFYYFACELWNHGRTLGKTIVNTRVIRLDGRDPTPGDFIIRAFFLLPDVIFSAGIPATLLTATSQHRQRLGDLVANTVVISERKFSGVTLDEVLAIRKREDHEPEFPEVQRFTDNDMIIVKHALMRQRQYKNTAHREAVRELAVKMADLIEIDKASVTYTPEQFLEKLLLDYIVLTR